MVAMSSLVVAAFAAGAAIGVLLAIAGLTGRRVLDVPSGIVPRVANSTLLPRLALATVVRTLRSATARILPWTATPRHVHEVIAP